MTKLESKAHRDNLLIDGIAEEKEENGTEVVKKMLKDDMKLDNVDDINVVRCHKLGYKRPGEKSRSIIIKFHWYGDKSRVGQARKNLKGKNIYINEDFPKITQDKRRILRPIMQKARFLNMKAFLNVDTLVIEETKYTVDNIGKLPPELDPTKIVTKEMRDNLLVFFWWS